MEGTPHRSASVGRHQLPACLDEGQASPFAEQWITITKQERIDLTARACYWEAQHARGKIQIEALKQEILFKDAKINDLQNRLFGKKSEKNSQLKSEKDGRFLAIEKANIAFESMNNIASALCGTYEAHTTSK
jgi:hypothetical protein